MRTPDFFIVGAPKCGTTAMNEYLGQHAEIFMCERKELHFFGSDLHFLRTPFSEQKYLSYFSKAKDHRRVGESSVWYLYSQEAAREIKEFCPHASIIIMLRNPVDMLYSLHGELLSYVCEDIADFEEALNAEEERRQGKRIPRGADPVEALFYRNVVKYTRQIQRYLDLFGRENIHIIIFDDFKARTAKVYAETLRFLRVDANLSPSFRVVNPTKKIRSRRVRLWVRLLLLAGQKFSRGFPEPILRSLPYLAIRRGLIEFAEAAKRLNTQYAPLPPMKPEVRRRLEKEFKPEVEKLSRLIDRDLSHWTQA